MKKTTLILIPGLVNTAYAWKNQIEALGGEAQIHVAEHGSCDSLIDMARHALSLTTGPVAIAGHSMGGRVALEAFRLQPERVVGLALLDTNYRALAAGEAGREEIAKRQTLLDIARRASMRAMVTEWIQGMVYAERLSDRSLIKAIVDMMSASPVEIFAAQIHALIHRPDAAELLPTVGCPTLVLCGREDSWSKVEFHEEMAARIARSTLVVVPECGHMSMLERPQTVTRAMRTWLKLLA